MRRLGLSILISTLTSLTVHAKVHSNEAVEFEIPDAWHCSKIKSNVKCDIKLPDQSAVGTLEANFEPISESSDSEFKRIASLFSKAAEFRPPSGQVIQSVPIFSRKIEIAGKQWLDTLHHAGTIPGNFTRYIATADSDLKIVITISVDKEKYNLVSAEIEQVIRSLRPYRKEIICHAEPEKSDSPPTPIASPPTPNENFWDRWFSR